MCSFFSILFSIIYTIKATACFFFTTSMLLRQWLLTPIYQLQHVNHFSVCVWSDPGVVVPLNISAIAEFFLISATVLLNFQHISSKTLKKEECGFFSSCSSFFVYFAVKPFSFQNCLSSSWLVSHLQMPQHLVTSSQEIRKYFKISFVFVSISFHTDYSNPS